MLKKIIGVVLIGCSSIAAHAQEKLPLTDLNLFRNEAKNWFIVGNATADLTKQNTLTTTAGTGVLACIHDQGSYGNQYELLSTFEHGDIDVEFDFMMAKGANSGIYLQGRYEIQLYDSWGKKTPKYNDLGGIYERWNNALPEGQKGYEGYAPRINAAKAPGLWQHIAISFQAPRFDASGKKTQNAKIIKITVNGMVVHENIELSGVTRGALTENEVALGPLRFQGDHGSLALKNIVINNFNKPEGVLSNLSYKAYHATLQHDADLSVLKPDDEGKLDALTYEFCKVENNYAYVVSGEYEAPTDGDYTFTIQISGNSTLTIDGKELLDNKWKHNGETRTVTTPLKAGKHSIALFNNKRDAWCKQALGLWTSGPGFREKAHHNLSSVLSVKPADPVIFPATENKMLRSFMDFKKSAEDSEIRIVHAISVGSPTNLHYTYDLDRGALAQVWRGGFLDATPMWHDRGDGSSRPMGSVTPLTNDLLLGKVTANNAWKKDTTGTGFRPKGYTVDDENLPTFIYQIFGANVSDKIRVVDGLHFQREIEAKNAPSELVARIAEGVSIEKISENLYAINNKAYYVRLEGNTTATLRSVGTHQELVVPATQKIIYSILF
jgi:Domain of Unknown Function (DUF1080)/PA14 domain